MTPRLTYRNVGAILTGWITASDPSLSKVTRAVMVWIAEDTILYAHRKSMILQLTLLDGKDRPIRTVTRLTSKRPSPCSHAVWMEPDIAISDLQMPALTSST